MQDLTPDLSLLSAEHEVILAVPVNAAGTAQPIGGFMASPGALTSGNVTLNGANEQILVGSATAPNVGKGVFIGNAGDGTYDFRAGDPSGHYIWYDASAGTLTVNGDVAVTALNIPDTTTANSFHTDASGNSWWGANVAGGYAAANAYILATGAAVFRSAQIGGNTNLYTVNNSGIYSFGDGSDGNATCDGSTAVTGMTLAGSTYTMTRDVYFNNLTINSGVILKPNGYRLFVLGTLTVNGTISRDGNAGTNGPDAVDSNVTISGGPGGAALSDGYLKGSLAGATGGNSVPGSGGSTSTGTNTTNSLGSNATAGGLGGSPGSPSGPAGSSGGGTVTGSNVKLIANWHLATLLDISSSGATVKFDNSASPGGGGGGGSDTTHTRPGGGGGGGGSPGGILAIYARILIVGATGVISANGGNGGNGGAGLQGPGTSRSGGGGGGAGGNGGQLILVYNVLTNAGSITANAGTGGTGGTSGNNGGLGQVNGSTGSTGNTGTIRQFTISL